MTRPFGLLAADHELLDPRPVQVRLAASEEVELHRDGGVDPEAAPSAAVAGLDSNMNDSERRICS